MRKSQNAMLIRKACLFQRSSHKLNALSGYNLTHNGGKNTNRFTLIIKMSDNNIFMVHTDI